MRCGTTLSSHEVAQGYQRVSDTSVYVKFKVRPDQKIGNFFTNDHTFILSWTTTPWTLPGNVALAIKENIEYVEIVEQVTSTVTSDHTYEAPSDERYIIAKEIFVHKNQRLVYRTSIYMYPVDLG